MTFQHRHSKAFTTLATWPDGYLALESDDFNIKIWNPNTGSLVYRLAGHAYGIETIATLSNVNFHLVQMKRLLRYGNFFSK